MKTKQSTVILREIISF
ncbi:hypothetical protein Nmel_000235 [Mimus melanotis]